MGDGDSVGWDNEMGEGDKDRAEGGLSAEAESSENLRREDEDQDEEEKSSITRRRRKGLRVRLG